MHNVQVSACIIVDGHQFPHCITSDLVVSFPLLSSQRVSPTQISTVQVKFICSAKLLSAFLLTTAWNITASECRVSLSSLCQFLAVNISQ